MTSLLGNSVENLARGLQRTVLSLGAWHIYRPFTKAVLIGRQE